MQREVPHPHAAAVYSRNVHRVVISSSHSPLYNLTNFSAVHPPSIRTLGHWLAIVADTNFFSSRWVTPSPAAWELARHREAALRPLAERKLASPLDVEAVAHELHLSRTQTYELIARYRKRPQTSTLLLGKCGRRPRSKFLKPAIEEVINDVVKRFFLTRERPRISDLLQHIHVACDEQGLPMPNYRTVRRRLRMLDPKLVTSKRFGAKAARQAFAPVHAVMLAVTDCPDKACFLCRTGAESCTRHFPSGHSLLEARRWPSIVERRRPQTVPLQHRPPPACPCR